MEKISKKLYGGAFVLAIGALISKVLGAVYRVPLTNVLGSEGLGLYQMIFPIYCVLLEFSGACVPSALSKMIASDESEYKAQNAKNLLINAVKLFLIIGSIGTLLMAGLSYFIANAQGNYKAFIGYIFLSPSVIAVSVISCFRGYFQGKANMKPTAISQVIEQALKLVFGLFLAYIFLPNIPLSAGGAALGVTLSEIISLLFLYLAYKRQGKKEKINFAYDKSTFKKDAKRLAKITLPITLCGIALPLSQFIDSFIIVNALNVYRSDGTALYGMFSGAVNTIISLPVALCYGLAAVAIPLVSSAKIGKENKSASKTLALTFFSSLIFAFGLYLFSPLAVRILFPSFSAAQKETTVSLIRLCSANVIFLSMIQTQNAVLIGLNKLYSPLISLSFGVTAKIIIEILLIPNPAYNVYGAAVAQIACYFISVLINFIMIVNPKVKNAVKKTGYREYVG